MVGTRLMQDQIDQTDQFEPELIELMLVPYVEREEAKRLAGSGP